MLPGAIFGTHSGVGMAAMIRSGLSECGGSARQTPQVRMHSFSVGSVGWRPAPLQDSPSAQSRSIVGPFRQVSDE